MSSFPKYRRQFTTKIRRKSGEKNNKPTIFNIKPVKHLKIHI